jgi:hypothetical protein
VDQAYFNRCDFEEALQEHGWSHLTTATRAEWGEVRAALGKPRRMSAKFLRGERHTLARYRTAVSLNSSVMSVCDFQEYVVNFCLILT